MTAQMLPTELLVEILTRLDSSPSDLFRVLVCSHYFADIVRPILYRHVTITTKRQRDCLENVRASDKRLVRHITIAGDGPTKFNNLEDHLRDGCELGSDCVRDLLTGAILDISVIETLHVRQIDESPLSSTAQRIDIPPAEFLVAQQLSELSVWRHQGAAPLWSSYLRNQYVPKLTRLGFVGVTRYDEDGNWFPSSTRGSVFGNLVEFDVTLESTFPYSQIEVLVAHGSDEFRSIPNFPLDNFLAVLDFNYAFTPASSMLLDERQMEWSMAWDFLYEMASAPSRVNNPPFHFFVSCFTGPCLIRYDDLISVARRNGHEVHVMDVNEDDFESTSLISPTFVAYLKQTGRLSSKT